MDGDPISDGELAALALWQGSTCKRFDLRAAWLLMDEEGWEETQQHQHRTIKREGEWQLSCSPLPTLTSGRLRGRQAEKKPEVT